MYYQKQLVPLKIDIMSKDSICLRLFLWGLFYLFLQIVAIGDKKRLINQALYPLQCNITQEQEQTCLVSGIFNAAADEIQLEVNITIETGDLYTLKKTTIDEQFEITNIESQLLIKGNQTYDNFTYLLRFILSGKIDIENYTDIIIEENLTLILSCSKYQVHYHCLGSLREFKTHHLQYICAEIKITKPPEYKTMSIKGLTAFYESQKYYQYLLVSQFLLTIILCYAIYYHQISVEGYHKIIKPLILQWMPYLLAILVLYNLPMQLFRETNQYFVKLYFTIIELLVQTTLFYFWLKIFELQKLQNMTQMEIIQNKYIKITNSLKLGLVILYTLPQTLMNVYVFYQKQILYQFDPNRDIPYYLNYQQMIGITLFMYSALYFYLLRRQFFYKIESASQNIQTKQYEIFDEFEEKKISAEMKSYKLLHVLSTICFIALVYNQYIRQFRPKQFSAHNTLNEWGLINIYVFIIVQLYVPQKIQQNNTFNFEQEADNRVKTIELADAI